MATHSEKVAVAAKHSQRSEHSRRKAGVARYPAVVQLKTSFDLLSSHDLCNLFGHAGRFSTQHGTVSGRVGVQRNPQCTKGSVHRGLPDTRSARTKRTKRKRSAGAMGTGRSRRALARRWSQAHEMLRSCPLTQFHDLIRVHSIYV